MSDIPIRLITIEPLDPWNDILNCPGPLYNGPAIGSIGGVEARITKARRVAGNTVMPVGEDIGEDL